MQSTLSCPEFEYEQINGYDSLLRQRTREALDNLTGKIADDAFETIKDTRRVHAAYFERLTPDGFDYYAGNYRGSDHACLKRYSVGVLSDGRVGHSPEMVQISMRRCIDRLELAVKTLDEFWSNSFYTTEQKLYRSVEIVAALFVYFLEVHPYANGNGHMARLVAILLLDRYGVRLQHWSIHPRPTPEYGPLISKYRDGDPADLLAYLLVRVMPPSA